MKKFLNSLILDAPRLFIKQYAYAWIVFIALWAGELNITLIFLAVIPVGMFLLKWQQLAWIEKIRAEYGADKFYVDNPPVPRAFAARNLLILSLIAAGASYFLNGRIGLTAMQFFLIIVGFSLLYRNSSFFGSPTTYIITNSGLGVYFAPGHLDSRLYIKFDEIRNIERSPYKKDMGWDCFARITEASDGLLLTAKNENGFAKRIHQLYIAPSDIEKFLLQLPQNLR